MPAKVKSVKASKAAADKAIADSYQHLSDLEHVLVRPDTYIGSSALVEDNIFIADIDSETPHIVKKKIEYVPGLIKIFDEIILNAYDQTVRDGTGCTSIRVDIDQATGTISITNNGQGIPVIKKDDMNCYIPEMLFSNLRTSSNYDDADSKKRITGGRNGLGGTMAVIFSKSFTLETIDEERKKRYVQSWTDNMSMKTEPVIKTVRSKAPFTKITFVPDLARFKLESLSDDHVMLMKKRLIDIGFATHSHVKTYYDGNLISIKKANDYMKLYDHPENEKFIVDDTNERWTVGVVLSNNGFQHASFVNGIHTILGGTHVDHVVNQITKLIGDKIKNKIKNITIKSSDIKNKIFVFIRAIIENPVFDSQAKETLKMSKKDFGSEFIMSKDFSERLLKSSIYASMTTIADTKELKDLEKTSGVKKSRLNDLPTLEDAAFTGTKKALESRLILTEGLSARTFAISAFNVIGRDRFGVFPLKGKLLNVRNATRSKVANNDEIKNIVRIVGLKYELAYEQDADMKSLRYGGIISLTDADLDGYHISGLILNFIHHFWPALLARGFLSFCITPIVKVTSGSKLLEFYTLQDYEAWQEKKTKGKFTAKYFKDLGTSTASDAREALKNIDQKLIAFKRDEQCDESISLAFNDKRADDRKQWLMTGYDPSLNIDRGERSVDSSDFIHKELIHFSRYDCTRSLPSVIDGLKPSQRKIIATAMMCAVKDEIKVAQLAPKCAERMQYHHGEVSLMGAIVNLAQNYVGSNNINLLRPIGQFGSRMSLGKDAASPRYIFTQMEPIAMKLFDPRDNALLTYLTSEQKEIEPEWFAPVLPVILINGTHGIGTGFSSDVLNYNPVDIANYIKLKLMKKTPERNIFPWYKGFTGEIVQVAQNRFTAYARWTFDTKNRILHITDLPITVSTDSYKMFCEDLLKEKDSPLDDVLYNNTDTIVDFKLVFKKDEFETWAKMDREDLVDKMRLKLAKKQVLSTSNMCLFDSNGCIKKYSDVYEIIDEYYHVRLELYGARREAIIEQLRYEMMILSNKTKFITMVKASKIDQRKMSEALLLAALEKNFKADPRASGTGLSRYEYLVSMSYRSFTDENATRMKTLVKKKEKELKLIEATTAQQMWIDDIDAIVDMFD